MAWKRSAAALLALLLGAAPAVAAQQVVNFKDWATSSYVQKGKRICYSFTEALVARPRKGGCASAVLVVTRGPSQHDRVVVSPCRPYAPAQSALRMMVAHQDIGFQARGRYAYADDGAAAVAAFRRGTRAQVAGPSGRPPERFSLRGFSAAYDRMRKDCIG